MRAITILGTLLLCGCGSTVTLEDLQSQAMLSGDWSAVEKRERMLKRRAERAGPNCGFGLIAYCTGTPGRMRCQCVDADSINGVFAYQR